jgi:hypothetical protein
MQINGSGMDKGSRTEQDKATFTARELEELEERISIMVVEGGMLESIAEKIAVQRIMDQRNEKLF